MTARSAPEAEAAPPAPAGFERVGEGGLGSPSATVAHAMVHWNGRLHLASTAPRGAGPADAARILSRDPQSGEWHEVHAAPPLPVSGDVAARAARRAGAGAPPPEALAREFGIRSLCVHQGPSDPRPCLYAGTVSHWGGGLLRSEDGASFEPVPDSGHGDAPSIEGLASFGGRLFAVTGGLDEGADMPGAPVLVCDDPAQGGWRPASAPAFGDGANRAITALAVAHGHLYAGTANPSRGFQLWRTEAGGEAPYDWERVLADGAHRFVQNHSVGAMAAHGDALYLGSALPGLGEEEDETDPAAFELIRLRADGAWDLICGEPRISPGGLKVPLSARGPGLGDPYNAAVLSLRVHEGRLHAGTRQWEPHQWAVHGGGEEMEGGFQLWSSADGEAWERAVADGHGRPEATALRALASAPEGLYAAAQTATAMLARQAGLEGVADDGFEVLLGR